MKRNPLSILALTALLLVTLSSCGGSQPVNTAEDEHTFEMLKAIMNGELQEVRDRIEKGANVNSVRNQDGTELSPLLAAVLRDQVEIVKLLVEKGADLNLKLDTKTNQDVPLVFHAAQSDIRILRYLVDNGIDVKATTPDKSTALMYACRTQKADNVRYLIQKKLDVNAKTSDGVTALLQAASSKNLEAARALVEAGANLDAVTTFGQSPLLVAGIRKDKAMVDYLLSKGADPNQADESGKTYKDYLEQDPTRYWKIRIAAAGMISYLWFDSKSDTIVRVKDDFNDIVGEEEVRDKGYSIDSGDFRGTGTRVTQRLGRDFTVMNLYAAQDKAVINTNYGNAMGTWSIVGKSSDYK